MNKLILFILLFCFTETNVFSSDVIENHYESALQAQNSNSYDEFLKKWIQTDILESIRNDIYLILEEVKTLTTQEKTQFFNELFFHWSNKRSKLKNSALELDKKIGVVSLDSIDSKKITDQLIRYTQEYETEVIIPVIAQIENEIKRDFNNKNLFFIGRDFTAPYLFISLKKSIDKNFLYTLNVSRKIRDLIFNHQTSEIYHLLNSIGLTKERLLKNGLVFMDSSMSGKIPRAILRAICENLNKSEATQFLKLVDFRYLRSKRVDGNSSFKDIINNYTRNNEELSSETIKKLTETDYFFSIQRFQIAIPGAINHWDADHVHNLLEHRHKFIQTGLKFKTKPSLHIYSDKPIKLSQKVISLLGLVSDLRLAETIIPVKKKTTKNQEKIRKNKKDLNKNELLFQEISEVHQKGFSAMKDWQYLEPLEGANDFFSSLEIKKSDDPNYPMVLTSNNAVLYKLKGYLGEGRNVQVFLSDKNRVIKITKNPKNARKSLLQKWTQDRILKNYPNFRHAKILYAHPTGVIVEQTYFDGKNLEAKYSQNPIEEIPKKIKNQVLEQWLIAKKIAAEQNIWLDFKAANFQVDNAEQIVNVDYTPRLNKGFYTYFFTDKTQTEMLSDMNFLKEFFYHDSRKNKSFSSNSTSTCQILFGTPGNLKK